MTEDTKTTKETLQDIFDDTATPFLLRAFCLASLEEADDSSAYYFKKENIKVLVSYSKYQTSIDIYEIFKSIREPLLQCINNQLKPIELIAIQTEIFEIVNTSQKVQILFATLLKEGKIKFLVENIDNKLLNQEQVHIDSLYALREKYPFCWLHIVILSFTKAIYPLLPNLR